MILADAHVHLYRHYTLDLLLEAAARNLSAQERSMDGGRVPCQHALLLAEPSARNPLHQLMSGEKVAGLSSWNCRPTAEPISAWAQSAFGEKILLVHGRQLNVMENLEVLAIASAGAPREGRPLLDSIEEIREQGGIPVVPWGVGKWWGGRGRVVRDVIEHFQGREVFLGDNGNRPVFWRRPRLFAAAAARGIEVLPGSDPLPFADGYRRAGAVGFALDGRLGMDTPGADLKRLLGDQGSVIRCFGELQRSRRFLRDQLPTQGRKLRRR